MENKITKKPVQEHAAGKVIVHAQPKAEKKLERARVVAIRVRGDVGLNPDIRKAMKILQLYNKNYCIVVENTLSNIGMIKKVKDFVTFGEIDKETFLQLMEKRARLPGNNRLTNEFVKDKIKTDIKGFVEEFYAFKHELKAIPGLKTFFRLHPPIGGFERAGIKKHFSQGGALGYRGKEINKLVLKML